MSFVRRFFMSGSRKRVRLPVADEEKNKGGRPPGSLNRLAKEARERAQETGALPHELLLQWGRGEPMSHKVCGPDSDPKDPSTWEVEYLPLEPGEIKDCAKSAAPYFAPKFATVEILHGVGNAELDALIAELAAEAGVGIGARGEGEEDEGNT
jgi:hypothetical protein